MDNLFFALFLISIICFILSWICPQIFYSLFKNKFRKKGIRIFFGASVLLFFILLGITVDVKEKENTAPQTQQAVIQETAGTETGEAGQAQQEADIIPQSAGEVKSELFRVDRAIDGDTIKLENGEVVRYIGIDTPETVHPSKPVQCFGKEASDKNKELVEGKEVRLEKDVSETDKYDRLLRYVYVGDIFVNDYLVRNGYANSSTFPPDVKYQEQFRQAEEEARNNKRGLWGDNACKTETPATTTTPSTSGSYTCNCSKTCPNMSSCAEAQYQLNVCGCTARDADHDGIACDSDCQ